MKRTILTFLSVILLLCLCSCNDSSTIDFDKIVNGDQTTNKEIIYTITFESNGGTDVDPIKKNTLSYSPYTKREGYKFLGWYFDSVLTQEAKFPITVTKNTVLYAKWEEEKHVVIFQTNGGTQIKSIKTDLIETEPQTKRENYIFDGWYFDSSFESPVTFPLNVEEPTALYAKWLLGKYSSKSNSTIVIDSGIITTEYGGFTITPQNFDFERLAKLNYKMDIEIIYTASYTKDYDAPLDIGYFGAPKFETYVKKSGQTVITKEDQKATKTEKTYTLNYTTSVSNIMNSNLTIEFWSDNVQNKLYFEDVVVTYQCYK